MRVTRPQPTLHTLWFTAVWGRSGPRRPQNWKSPKMNSHHHKAQLSAGSETVPGVQDYSEHGTSDGQAGHQMS